jgi:hypothetical protein
MEAVKNLPALASWHSHLCFSWVGYAVPWYVMSKMVLTEYKLFCGKVVLNHRRYIQFIKIHSASIFYPSISVGITDKIVYQQQKEEK